jgi:hypothetical protein
VCRGYVKFQEIHGTVTVQPTIEYLSCPSPNSFFYRYDMEAAVAQLV